MDFQLSEDQKALREGLRSFCEARVSDEQLVALEATHGFERALWGELAEMGVFGLRLPEADGGVGLGSADAVIVFAELGRRVVPGPLVWTHLAAGLVDGAASGETVVGGLEVNGVGPLVVEHLDALDTLLVLRDDGLFRCDPRALKVEPIATPLDPLTQVHLVQEAPDGERVGDADDATRLRREGATLVAAQMLGIAETTLQMAVAYTQGREQFGRPVGSFQALKHIMADMFVRQESARAAVYAAGATLDAPEVGDLDRAVASAKINAGDAALRNARACIQLHGGMGYTWEVPAHYFLKRTWVCETSFGTVDWHSERVADALDSGE